MADKWSANANKALSLSLIGAPPSLDANPFPPDFTYQIGFGAEETIFGYSNLSVRLSLSAGSLYPDLTVKWEQRNENTTAKVDDVQALMGEFMPEEEEDEAEGAGQSAWLKDDQGGLERIVKEEIEQGWRPLGDKVAGYTRSTGKNKGKGKRAGPGAGAASKVNGDASSSSSKSNRDSDDRHFEVFRTTWATPGWRAFHRRMQIFALLYIEGASYIHEDEDNWEWLSVFEKWTDEEGRERWCFVGYTSLYRFWHYPSSSRLRLSQFVILPPYRKQAHGTQLYSTVYGMALADSNISELTIEDPNEAFDHLRDVADLRTLLRPGGVVDQMKEEEAGIAAPLDRTRSEEWRKKAKIAKRQWGRLIEMIQLMELDPSDRASIKAYRLQVKARLYRFNKDVLTQLDVAERHAKLQETYENLLDGEYGDLVGVDVEPFLDGPEGDGPEVNGFGAGNKKRRM